VLVTVDAVSSDGRSRLTRFGMRRDGRKVPVPLGFSVQPEEAEAAVYELSAAIHSGDRLLRLTGPLLLIPEGASARPKAAHLRKPLETGFGQAWQCATTSVMFETVGQHAFLAVDGRLHPAEQIPAASGVRYRSTDDPALAIYEKVGEIEDRFRRAQQRVRDKRGEQD